MAWEPPQELTVTGERKEDKYPPNCPVCGSRNYTNIWFLPHRNLIHEKDCTNQDFQPKPPQWRLIKNGLEVKKFFFP